MQAHNSEPTWWHRDRSRRGARSFFLNFKTNCTTMSHCPMLTVIIDGGDRRSKKLLLLFEFQNELYDDVALALTDVDGDGMVDGGDRRSVRSCFFFLNYVLSNL